MKEEKRLSKIKTLIPRQQFEVPVQAAIGQKIVARTNIKSMGKMFYLNVMVEISVVNENF